MLCGAMQNIYLLFYHFKKGGIDIVEVVVFCEASLYCPFLIARSVFYNVYFRYAIVFLYIQCYILYLTFTVVKI
jgi:hypothetical protein